MSIRKALLLTLILLITSLGLTLTGCEKHDHPTAEHPSTEAAEDVAEDAADEAEGTVKEVEAAAEEAASDHPQ
jgi:Cu/Ag efflux protein CusF